MYLNKKFMSLAVILSFFVNVLEPLPVHAQDMALPKPGTMVNLSPVFNAPVLKGIKVYVNDPFRFDFILDKGDAKAGNAQLKEESMKLIKYFLASLTIPENDLWVNLSPYEKNRIVPQSFGLTEMGRDLLAEDYMLKQITASLIYPEDAIGKKFWNKVYAESEKKFGTTSVPVNTFNKVWIVPERASIYENAKNGTAYVVESKLKVMLEQDYLALAKSQEINKEPSSNLNAESSNIIREIIIPELTKEVNEDRNFASLRQAYSSLILATWYKQKIKDSILAQVYADRKKVLGVNINDPQEIQRIYGRYLQAFKKGVYNYIKEDVDPSTQELVPRKYFSGGVDFAMSGNSSMKGIGGVIQRVDLPKEDNIKSLYVIQEETLSAKGTDQAMRSGAKSRSNWLSFSTWRSFQEKLIKELNDKDLRVRLNAGKTIKLLVEGKLIKVSDIPLGSFSSLIQGLHSEDSFDRQQVVEALSSMAALKLVTSADISPRDLMFLFDELSHRDPQGRASFGLGELATGGLISAKDIPEGSFNPLFQGLNIEDGDIQQSMLQYLIYLAKAKLISKKDIPVGTFNSVAKTINTGNAEGYILDHLAERLRILSDLDIVSSSDIQEGSFTALLQRAVSLDRQSLEILSILAESGLIKLEETFSGQFIKAYIQKINRESDPHELYRAAKILVNFQKVGLVKPADISSSFANLFTQKLKVYGGQFGENQRMIVGGLEMLVNAGLIKPKDFSVDEFSPLILGLSAPDAKVRLESAEVLKILAKIKMIKSRDIPIGALAVLINGVNVAPEPADQKYNITALSVLAEANLMPNNDLLEVITALYRCANDIQIWWKIRYFAERAINTYIDRIIFPKEYIPAIVSLIVDGLNKEGDVSITSTYGLMGISEESLVERIKSKVRNYTRMGEERTLKALGLRTLLKRKLITTENIQRIAALSLQGRDIPLEKLKSLANDNLITISDVPILFLRSLIKDLNSNDINLRISVASRLTNLNLVFKKPLIDFSDDSDENVRFLQSIIDPQLHGQGSDSAMNSSEQHSKEIEEFREFFTGSFPHESNELSSEQSLGIEALSEAWNKPYFKGYGLNWAVYATEINKILKNMVTFNLLKEDFGIEVLRKVFKNHFMAFSESVEAIAENSSTFEALKESLGLEAIRDGFLADPEGFYYSFKIISSDIPAFNTLKESLGQDKVGMIFRTDPKQIESLLEKQGNQSIQKSDLAMKTEINSERIDKNGGIDLTLLRSNLQTQIGEGEIRFNLDAAMLHRLLNTPGFMPIIIGIKPMTNLRLFLGATN